VPEKKAGKKGITGKGDSQFLFFSIFFTQILNGVMETKDLA
jgi:hypothetical protein